MSSAPDGLSKAPAENADAIANATSKPRPQRKASEQKKITDAVKKADTTDEKAKVTTGSPAEGEVLPKAEPEATSDPTEPITGISPEEIKGEQDAQTAADPKSAPIQTDQISNHHEVVPEGQVEVTRKAQEGELADPAGNRTEARKTGAQRAPKKDTLKKVDTSKLPVAVTVGQVVGVIEQYAGNAVLSLSLKGWVGEAPLKILASDVGEIEQVLSELRKELG